MSGQDVLRRQIADAVRAHRPGASIDAYTCDCGVPWTSVHVADAAIAALGLVAVYGARQDEDIVWGWEPDVATVRREWPGLPIVRSYVTPWERIEEDA